MKNKKKNLQAKDLKEYSEDYRAKIKFENRLKYEHKLIKTFSLSFFTIILIISFFLSGYAQRYDELLMAITFGIILTLYGLNWQLEQKKINNPPICSNCNKKMRRCEYTSGCRWQDLRGIVYLCEDCKSKIIDTEPSQSG